MRPLTILNCNLAFLLVVRFSLGQVEYTEWSGFDRCTVTCGGGVQTRTRKCLANVCDKHLKHTRNCGERKCPRSECSDTTALCGFQANLWCGLFQDRCRKTCGVCKDDGEPQPWAEYGPCSVTCGFGLKTRSNGKETQDITCVLPTCKEDKPTWSSWGTEEPCSVTCGGGFTISRRTCSIPGACSGKDEQQKKCQIQPCTVSEYTNWSDFDECTVTCGGGVQTRTRKCLVDACDKHLEHIRNCGGKKCPKSKCSDATPVCGSQPSLWCGVPSLRNQCRKTCRVCKDDGEQPQPWAEYGPCSVTCGFGLKTRSNGKETQSITCILLTCKEDKPTWSSWGTEEPCSVTCGGGFAMRRRTCSIPGACSGQDEQQNRCQIQPCTDYTKWSKYGECSTKCGGGVRTRTRTCLKLRCTGHLEEIENCQMKECKERATKCTDSSSFCRGVTKSLCASTRSWRRSCRKSCGVCKVEVTASWTEYGPCSVTCGAGLKTRTKDSEKQSITCLMEECKADYSPKWSAWSVTSPCSAMCGGGTEIRSRTCSGSEGCMGDAEETVPCNTDECQEYSRWSKFEKCSLSCGGGIQSRTRTCLVETCPEHLEEIRNCKTDTCRGDRCVDSSPSCARFGYLCSNRRIRRNCPKTCGACKKVSTWSEYGPCSVTCGAGLMIRNKDSASQSITCVLDKCPEVTGPTWTSWIVDVPCSVTCGGGVETRTRSCSVPGACAGNDEETVECATQSCPEWGEWMDATPCDVTCGEGSLLRRRECSVPGGCPGEDEERTPCELQECPNWLDWSEWSECSTTCGPGLTVRERECSVPGRCEGVQDETEECLEEDCEVAEWNDWSDWTDCSATCGLGMMSRDRTCSIPGDCDGEDTEMIDCVEEDCEISEWSDWSDWSDCSETCGPGTMVRQRSCSIPDECEGEDTEVEECFEEDCRIPEWGEWTDATPCDVTCGGGSLLRRRECSEPGGCPGQDEERIPCESQDCPRWGKWSGWGPCSKTCGPGESARSRTCDVPSGCVGDSEETQECIAKPCEEVAWSRCSKSCGGGTRRRYYCNGTECEWQFEGCAGSTCPEAPCHLFGLLFKNRYNSTHECCVVDRTPADEQCGRQIPKQRTLTESDQKRIIGGIDAVEDQWPWMVAVYMAGSGFCAGSIISTKFILSASHCFAFDSGQPRNVSEWRIFAGILQLSQFQLDLGLKIKKTYIHPDYTYPIADIALVELEKELTFTPSIQPICLPHGEVTPEEATCIVTGWGVSTVPDTVTNHLQELAVSNFDPRVCVHAYGKHEALKNNVPFLKENKGYICAGSLTREIDSCSGDSGGPLVCQRCDSCSWYITGVVSFGPNPCALIGVPGVYSKVLYYEDWIVSTTNMKRHSLSCSKP